MGGTEVCCSILNAEEQQSLGETVAPPRRPARARTTREHRQSWTRTDKHQDKRNDKQNAAAFWARKSRRGAQGGGGFPPLPGGLASHVDAEIAEYARISVGISGTMSKSQRGQGSEVRGRRSPTS